MAHFICSQCKRFYDEKDVSFDTGQAICQSCKEGKTPEKAEDAKPAKIPGEAEKPAKETSFLEGLVGSFFYQFRGSGLTKLFAGALFFWILNLVARWSLFGFIIAILVSGYLCAFMIKIINSAATGNTDLPDWPDFTDIWDSVLSPLFMVIGTTLASFGPAIIYGVFLLSKGANPLGLVPLIILGLLYQPMALLAVAISNSFTALSPAVVIRSIFRVKGKYAVICLTLIFIVAIRQLFILILIIPLPIINSILASFLSLYFLTVHMRILGLLYLHGRKELGWD